jgi:hypothetical protein
MSDLDTIKFCLILKEFPELARFISENRFICDNFQDEDFKKCWALDNLRPMWFIDNCKKGSRCE